MKKVLSIVLSIVFVLLITVPAFSFGDTHRKDIISALRKVEYKKVEMGLAGVDFEKLTISRPISAYNYVGNGLIKSRVLHPLLYNEKLVALAIEVQVGDDLYYQISTALAQAIDEIVSATDMFALIYDDTCCYICINGELDFLLESGMKSTERSHIEENTAIDYSDIEFACLINSKDLGYSSESVSTFALPPRVYSCGVSYVTQLPYSNICWAATTACIANYVNGSSLTAFDVASSWYLLEPNTRLPDDEIEELLDEYNLNYSFKHYVPSTGGMVNNIKNGYPIFGKFLSSSGSGHAVTVYGIDVLGGTLNIMDPESGVVFANYSANNGYCYLSEYADVTLTFIKAACRYWTSS